MAWYRMCEMFDGSKRESVPFKDMRAYVEGKIGDLVVMSYPRDTPLEMIGKFANHLRKRTDLKGRCLVVSDDVKFMRLEPASEEEVRRLDEVPEPK